MAKPDHARALDVLIHRGTRHSRVLLADGRTCVVWNIAWGYDIGDDVAHITTNISPTPEEEAVIDFFRADEVVAIDDAESGQRLFAKGAAGEAGD